MINFLKKLKQRTKSFLYKKFSNIKWSSTTYNSWSDAELNSLGYSESTIIEKVSEAALLAKKNNQYYERDGALIKITEIDFKLLTAILLSTGRLESIKVLDVGGSLGSTFFQYKDILLNRFKNIRWNIVEQKKFVSIGKKYFEDNYLKFFNIDDELDDNFDLVIFASCLNYIDNYQDIFENNIQKGRAIIVDRTQFSDQVNIRIQSVKKYPYNAKYPHISFPLKHLEDITEKYGFNKLLEWDAIQLHSDYFLSKGVCFTRHEQLCDTS